MKILHANAFGVIIDDDKIEPLKEYAKEALKDIDEVSVDEFSNNDIVRNSFITKVFEKW